MFLSRSYIDALRSDAWRIPWAGTPTLTDALTVAFRVPEEELETRFGMDTSLSISLNFMDSGGMILRRQG